ncbi:hypothetical protein H6F73_22655 [Microcoleus sp. FACHB-68]|nr:hypothetical protein [Microcoleus sp. FACHB-68]
MTQVIPASPVLTTEKLRGVLASVKRLLNQKTVSRKVQQLLLGIINRHFFALSNLNSKVVWN